MELIKLKNLVQQIKLERNADKGTREDLDAIAMVTAVTEEADHSDLLEGTQDLTQCTNNMENMINELKESKAENETLAEVLSSTEQDFKKAKTALEERNEQLNKLNNDNIQLKKIGRNFREKLRLEEAKNAIILEQKASLDVTIKEQKKLVEDHEHLKKDSTELTEQINKLEDVNFQLKKAANESTKKLIHAEIQNSKLWEEKMGHDVTIEELKAEKNNLKEELVQLKVVSNNLKSSNAQLRLNNTELKKIKNCYQKDLLEWRTTKDQSGRSGYAGSLSGQRSETQSYGKQTGGYGYHGKESKSYESGKRGREIAFTTNYGEYAHNETQPWILNARYNAGLLYSTRQYNYGNNTYTSY